MVEILHYTSGLAEVKAGVETYILNMNDAMDHTQYQFTLLTRNAKAGTPIYNMLVDKGIKIVDLNIHNLTPKSVLRYYKALKSFFRENQGRFSFLHFHGCDDPFVISLGKKYGIQRCGVHAHSVTRENENRVLRFLKNISASYNIKKADYLFASCKEAGEARFGARPFEVLHNTVDVDRFRFNEAKRRELRRNLKIEDKFVICFVGRFVEIKNIPFAINVFEKIKEVKEDVELLLIGDGELMPEISKQVTQSPCKDSILVLGNRDDIPELLSASDLYIQTSFSEGFSISVLEAQCAGLPMYLTTGFPEEVELTDLVNKLSLNEGAIVWAGELLKEMEKIKNVCPDRTVYAEKIQELGYDTISNTQKMCKLYAGGTK